MLLIELVDEHGKNDWELIASELAEKSSKKTTEKTPKNCRLK
jgi:hypothetical protein